MDDKTLVEPSNDEQSQWPQATEAYVRGLEEINEAQATRIEALEAALRDMVKGRRELPPPLHADESCLCNRCAAGAGDLRSRAKQALESQP